ncbi:MAG: hypothetical protein EOO11_11710 [Chitinophagaceae bacterium]|nr:MAG: hypothetical protein EOO11_11710 [Chitinophagaceae bacterium]
MTPSNHAALVRAFIEAAWNARPTEDLSAFLHPGYADASLPPHFPAGAEGLRRWIAATGAAFDHHTTIEDLVADERTVAVRLTFRARHIGPWRGIGATGQEVTVKGFRFFSMQDGRIIGHHALIDGEALEAALRGAAHGCALPRQQNS